MESLDRPSATPAACMKGRRIKDETTSTSCIQYLLDPKD
jgi:hypothetical protein